MIGINIFRYKFDLNVIMKNVFQVCIHSAAYTLLQWNQTVKDLVVLFRCHRSLTGGAEKNNPLVRIEHIHIYTVIQYKTHCV